MSLSVTQQQGQRQRFRVPSPSLLFSGKGGQEERVCSSDGNQEKSSSATRAAAAAADSTATQGWATRLSSASSTIWLDTTTTTNTTFSVFRRSASLDSSVVSSEAAGEGAPVSPACWNCSQCSYLNVDTLNRRCAICGGTRSQHQEHHEDEPQKGGHSTTTSTSSNHHHLASKGTTNRRNNKPQASVQRHQHEQLHSQHRQWTVRDEDETEEGEPVLMQKVDDDFYESTIHDEMSGREKDVSSWCTSMISANKILSSSRLSSRPGADDGDVDQVEQPPKRTTSRLLVKREENDAGRGSSTSSTAAESASPTTIHHHDESSSDALAEQQKGSTTQQPPPTLQPAVSCTSMMSLTKQNHHGDDTSTVRTSNRTALLLSRQPPLLLVHEPSADHPPKAYPPATTNFEPLVLVEGPLHRIPVLIAKPGTPSIPSRHPALRGETDDGDEALPPIARSHRTMLQHNISRSETIVETPSVIHRYQSVPVTTSMLSCLKECHQKSERSVERVSCSNRRAHAGDDKDLASSLSSRWVQNGPSAAVQEPSLQVSSLICISSQQGLPSSVEKLSTAYQHCSDSRTDAILHFDGMVVKAQPPSTWLPHSQDSQHDDATSFESLSVKNCPEPSRSTGIPFGSGCANHSTSAPSDCKNPRRRWLYHLNILSALLIVGTTVLVLLVSIRR